MRYLIGITFGAYVSFVALASAAESRYTTIIGRSSCETWQIEQADNSSWSQIVNSAWLFGYMSGLNSSGDWPADLLADIDAETIKDWMKKYCNENPSSNVARGASELLGILAERKRK
jgi:hypothetical protein